MVQQNIGFVSLLVRLVQLVDRIPLPPQPSKGGRGRPSFYSDRHFLKAVVIMIVRHLHTPYELLSVLQQPPPEMQALRSLLVEVGRYPVRRTWERRLKALPDKLPAQTAPPAGVAFKLRAPHRVDQAAITQRLCEQVCSKGNIYITTTVLPDNGLVIRACILNHKTNRAIVDKLVADVTSVLDREAEG